MTTVGRVRVRVRVRIRIRGWGLGSPNHCCRHCVALAGCAGAGGDGRSDGSIPVLDDDRVGSRVASAQGGVQDERGGVVQGEVIDRILADHAIDHEQDLVSK